MKIVCSWCKTVMQEKPSPDQNQKISHGICDVCRTNTVFQLGVPQKQFIEDIKEPSCIINPEGRVITANQAALKTLGKTLSEILNLPGGNVFECAYARLPEGCGRTIHCSGCTIRRTVTKTYETSEPQYRIPAVLKYGSLKKSQNIHMLISTEKISGVVFIKVEYV
ncbi:MAG: PAS domain-containing protein [Candidatus Aureabacteria bacterium]|nr:PAS domain-containing protein [Candidatus Auribacterota bacterium]